MTTAKELPRFTKAGTDRHALVHACERDSGTRATFHVYYRHNGRLLFDPSWEKTPEDAITAIANMAKAVRMKIEPVGFTRPSAEVSL